MILAIGRLLTHNRFNSLMVIYNALLCATSNSVLTFTLNRPERYNALNEAMKKELNAAFKLAENDDTVRCIVLRGAGERAFCSGQDLKEHSRVQREIN